MNPIKDPSVDTSLTSDVDDLILERFMENIADRKKDVNLQELNPKEIPWEHERYTLEKTSNTMMDLRAEQLEASIETQRTEICDLQKSISQINANIRDLLAIYEFVSKHFNPYDDTDLPAQNAQRPEISHEPPQNIIQERDNGTNGENGGNEGPVTSEIPNNGGQNTMLACIPENNQLAHVIILRWLEFLLQRVKRERMPPLLDYYIDINWISEEVKDRLLTFMRGEIPDIMAYEPDNEQFNEVVETLGNDDGWHRQLNNKNVDEWRLTAEDHLKSYLFIQRILGNDTDLNVLNQVEREIESIQGNLKKYHGL